MSANKGKSKTGTTVRPTAEGTAGKKRKQSAPQSKPGTAARATAKEAATKTEVRPVAAAE